MRPARERRDHLVVADADMAVAVAGEAMAAVVGTVVAAAMAASEGAIKVRKKNSEEPIGREFGQGWIRTSEGVKPADLQSAPFGHFGTYP